MPRSEEIQLPLFKGRGARQPAPEFHLQCLVADVLRRWQSPDWMWTHIGHGGLRTKATAGQLPRAGLMPGWPDLILLSPDGRPHFLELKRRGARLREEQERFGAWCHAHAVPFAWHDNFTDALATLQAWRAVRGGIYA